MSESKTETPKIPAGTLINHQVLNPLPSVQITFPRERQDVPLAPLIQSSYVESSNTVEVSAVLFINTDAELSFNVYQLYCVGPDGKHKLQFCVCYDIPEGRSTTFNAYQVNFAALQQAMPDTVSSSNVAVVEVFSWDCDPVVSRGSDTPVIPGT